MDPFSDANADFASAPKGRERAKLLHGQSSVDPDSIGQSTLNPAAGEE